MHRPPEEERRIAEAFHALVNLSVDDLSRWLETEESRRVGFVRRGETESVGRQSGRKILAILATPPDARTDADYDHMKKVIGYCRRHLAQRPAGDVSRSRWRYSLMNWGHDPLKDSAKNP